MKTINPTDRITTATTPPIVLNSFSAQSTTKHAAKNTAIKNAAFRSGSQSHPHE